MSRAPRHFLDLDLVGAASLRHILELSAEMKRARGANDGKAVPQPDRPLAGKLLAMVFERPSTRTRVSFDVAMRQLGGESVVLNAGEMQIGRGESIADTARVLSRYVDAIMIRIGSHSMLQEMAQTASVPVINGLTERSHPCQLMADVLTFEEHRGPITGKVVAWVGDGNNMASSWIHAATCLDFELRLACPEVLSPPPRLLEWAKDAGGRVRMVAEPEVAVEGADCVVTDAWVSMGDDTGDRHNLLRPYQVNSRLMAQARPDAVFMHCLPAHRGEEVTADVIDGPHSIVFDEAENRLHAQKGILAWCLAE